MSEEPEPLQWLEIQRDHPDAARVSFRRQLSETNEQLVAIGEAVAGSVVPVTTGFLQADHPRVTEVAEESRRTDHRLGRLEEACYVLLARQQPVASDLRRVVSTLSSVSDLRRSANLVRHIGSSLHWVHPPSLASELRGTIREFGEASAEILGAGVAAWRTFDALAANDLDARDDRVDLLQKDLLSTLYTGGHSVEDAVSLALIARYYERLSDHGVQIARNAAYFLSGEAPPKRDPGAA